MKYYIKFKKVVEFLDYKKLSNYNKTMFINFTINNIDENVENVTINIFVIITIFRMVKNVKHYSLYRFSSLRYLGFGVDKHPKWNLHV